MQKVSMPFVPRFGYLHGAKQLQIHDVKKIERRFCTMQTLRLLPHRHLFRPHQYVSYSLGETRPLLSWVGGMRVRPLLSCCLG